MTKTFTIKTALPSSLRLTRGVTHYLSLDFHRGQCEMRSNQKMNALAIPFVRIGAQSIFFGIGVQAGKASGPEFFAEVMGLGDKHYYAPLEMKASGR